MGNVLVSVVLPIYKANQDYLKEAIDSILNQTYKNIELILVIDEDSSYGTVDFLESYHDSRIIVLDNRKNRGLVYSLNRGIFQSRGKYIFRMDSDDISKNNRIEKQVDFLERNPNVDIVGSFAKTFGEDKKVYKSYTSDSEIKGQLLLKNPIIHPTVCFRSSFLKTHQILYTEGISEDYRLWLELSLDYDCNFAVIPEVLLLYRIHPNQITNRDKNQLSSYDRTIVKYIDNKLGTLLNKHEITLFTKVRNRSCIYLTDVFQCLIIVKKISSKIKNSESKSVFKKEFCKYLIQSILNSN